MGILHNGITGSHSGKVGNLVFYMLNGKQVVRTIGKTTKPPTIPQLKCRQEMAVSINFLKQITEFIEAGFKLVAKTTNKYPFNVAVSYHKMNALQGTYPNIEIAYEKVLVTQGVVLEAINPAVGRTLIGLNFSWDCPEVVEWPRTNDVVMVLVYFPLIQKTAYMLSGVNRLRCAEFLPLHNDLLNEYMEVYISFVAENRGSIANSTYLGSFNK
jgi:hypothetical protein